MLTQIHIRDLATIAELHLNLHDGTNMITGETGAGKSVFLEAIELTLGGRASANMIRPGKEKAEISLSFDISRFPHVVDKLKALDLYQEIDECIIRRVITTDGRSRSYVNGSPQTLHLVKELGELLFHLHGQHEQQVLLQSEKQREMLDRYADHIALTEKVRENAENWREIAAQITELREKTHERTERADYLRFQLSELDSLQLKSGEWENLEAEHHRLTHSEELLRHIQLAVGLLADDEAHNILSSLNSLQKTVDSIQQVEPKAAEWNQSLSSAIIALSDVESELKNYLENTELDPERLQYLESRISQIYNLSRKHKVAPQELIELQNKIADELKSLDSSDTNLLALETQQKKMADEYVKCAEQLSASRQKAARKLEKDISATIRSLSLPHGEFAIQLEKETGQFSLHGNEKIIFLIKTNPDQALQPLGKVISGGELSRLSLAAHLALANRTSIPTLVFDEVDTGLSGATAEKIGRLLRTLGESYQVFCVTHQPQVAACGHHHLLVEKYFVEQSTHTRLRILEVEERTREIARMLGGEKITEKTLAHAREVLQGA